MLENELTFRTVSTRNLLLLASALTCACGGTEDADGAGGSAGGAGAGGAGAASAIAGTSGEAGSPNGGTTGGAGGAGGASQEVDAGDACARLDACCADSSIAAACDNVASGGDAELCEAVERSLCTDGAPAPRDAGVPTGDCTSLATCCESLSGPETNRCNTIVQGGNATMCGAIEGRLCP